MKKIAFYGVGEQFELNIVKNDYVHEKLKHKIVGFIDQGKCGKSIKFNGICYTVQSLENWTDYSLDKIIITPAKNRNEIMESLVEHGFKNEQIVTLDKMLFYLFDNIELIESCIAGKGLEIGGPSSVFSYIYDKCKECDGINFSTDTVWWKQNSTSEYIWGNRAVGKMYIRDATMLTDIPDEAYDFVLSSNNLEHIANPVKAFSEFYRVVKKNGMIIIVVPRKFANFDHNRQFTSFEHILSDYRNNVTEDDLSHLSEIIEMHDYDMDPASGGKEKFLQRAEKNFENRCLHHHVFDRKCLEELFENFNLKILEFAETYSDYWIIGKK